MKTLSTVIAAVLLVTLGVAAFIWSGTYDIGADSPHLRLTHSILETIRERSVAVRADEIAVPGLQDSARIRRGAGNYDAMCASCHLAPGVAESELSRGLYPEPPELSKPVDITSAQAFWTIKHGIKASGMPAWGKSMPDGDIWDLVAFLSKLPTLTPAQYEAEVAASGGHSHSGGEMSGHEHSGNESNAHGMDESAVKAQPHHDEAQPHHDESESHHGREDKAQDQPAR